MSDTADPMGPVCAALHMLGLTATEAYVAYFAVGGNQGEETVTAWLHGRRNPPDTEYDLLATAINDKLVERGLNPNIPYRMS